MSKKYSINIEDEQVVSVEIDGVVYEDPDQIPDQEDRARIIQLMDGSSEDDFDEIFDQEFDREFEAEFQELQRRSARFPTLIVAIFLGVALIMLAVAAISAFNSFRRLSREESAPGQVVDLVLRRYQPDSSQDSREFYYPVVEFNLPDGSRQHIQLSEGSWPPAYSVGEPVTVLYDPGNPQEARIQSGSSTLLMWILPAITGTIGVAFLVVLIIVFKMRPAGNTWTNPLGASEQGDFGSIGLAK
jgi:hypothetical protein